MGQSERPGRRWAAGALAPIVSGGMTGAVIDVPDVGPSRTLPGRSPDPAEAVARAAYASRSTSASRSVSAGHRNQPKASPADTHSMASMLIPTAAIRSSVSTSAPGRLLQPPCANRVLRSNPSPMLLDLKRDTQQLL